MKVPFTVQLEKETRHDFERTAEAAHMDATKYAATWLAELSTLKPEFALKALGMIPSEWKHRRPGRPAGPATADRKVDQITEQNVA
jgi:hypothetical protein